MEIFEQNEFLVKKIKNTFGENIKSIELISRIRGTVYHNGECFFAVENKTGKFALIIGKVYECYTSSLIYRYFLGYDIQIKQLTDFVFDEIIAPSWQDNDFYFRIEDKWGVTRYIGFDEEIGIEPIYDKVVNEYGGKYKLYQGDNFDLVRLTNNGIVYLVKNCEVHNNQVRVMKLKKKSKLSIHS